MGLGGVKLPGALDGTSEPKENTADLESEGRSGWGVKLGIGETGLLESDPGAAGMWPALQQAEQGDSGPLRRPTGVSPSAVAPLLGPAQQEP